MSKNLVRAIRVGHRCPDVARIIHDPDLYDRMAEDGSPAQIAIPKGPDYILGLAHRPASLLVEHGGKIHFMVLKPYRKRARELWAASLKVLGLRKVYCEIPSKFMETINFAKHVGFVETSISPPS